MHGVLRRFLLLWVVTATGAFAAADESSSPELTAPLERLPVRNVPATLPRTQTSSSKVQLRGADAELNVDVVSRQNSGSVFDQLSANNNPTAAQKAQILLRRSLLDDVTLTNTSNFGLADATPATRNSGVTAKSAQNQSTTEVKWTATDKLSITTSSQTDGIFEAQRADPTRSRSALESRYHFEGDGSIVFGVANENFFELSDVSFERDTTMMQFEKKLDKLPLRWTATPSMIKEYDPQDAAAQRAGQRLEQSLLWTVDPKLSWRVGSGVTNWDYAIDSHQLSERTLFSQWNRQIRPNFNLIFRTDLQSNETTPQEASAASTREDRFKLSIGQRLTIADDLTAAFDLRQEYQRELNSTWAPADHAATLSIQKKF